MIPHEYIGELTRRTDIVELVGGYVQLKRKGRLYGGLCPFHSEKTPSFYVYPDTQSFYCFGCQASGDAVGFIKKINNISGIEAIKLLAQRAGMPEPTEDDKTGRLRSRILTMNKDAARFFHGCLNSTMEEARQARAYWRRRGLDDKTINRFGLGYAPDDGQALYQYLRDKGYNQQELDASGLLPVFYFLNRKNTSLLHLCRTQFEGGVLLKACVNGSSELMTNLSMSLVNILYNYQLLRFAGEDGVAAYGVIMYASFLFVAVFVGYAVGSAPIVSYHYGANNRKEVNNLYRKSLKLIGVVAVGMTIGSMFIIPHVARFFVGYDENLLILTTRAFRLYGLSFLIMGFNVYASSFFTALGDGVTSALISFLRTLLFQVAAVLLLPLLLGIDGIWLAVTAAELAALLVSIGLFITRDQQFHYRKAE